MNNNELQNMVSKFNKRVERMYNYSNGSLPSLDELRHQLYMLTGKESEIPKVSLKGIGADDRVKLVGIMNAYFNNPESSIKAYTAIQNKSIGTYASNNGLTSNQIEAFNTLVKSPEFAKLKEITYRESRDRMDNINTILSSGLNGKQAIKIVTGYIKSDKKLSFREWVDNAVYNTREKTK